MFCFVLYLRDSTPPPTPPPPKGTLTGEVYWDFGNSSCRFWQKRGLIIRYSSSKELLRFFTLHFVCELSERMYPRIWIGRGLSIIGHQFLSLTLPFFCWGYMIDVVYVPPLRTTLSDLLWGHELFVYIYTHHAYKLMGCIWINMWFVPQLNICKEVTETRSCSLPKYIYTSFLFLSFTSWTILHQNHLHLLCSSLFRKEVDLIQKGIRYS
jgi:hypothetical protein